MIRKEWIGLAILLFLALTVRIFFLSRVQVLQPDETYYIGMAAGMGEGGVYGGFDSQPFRKSPFTEGRSQGQPLIPFLFLLIGRWLGQRWILGAQAASLGAFLLTVPLFYSTVRLIGSKREAFFSALIFVLAPFSIHYSILGMTHSVYIFFICAFLLSATKVLLDGKLQWGMIAGACLFGAYLTRAEAFFLFAYLILLGGLSMLFFSSARRYAKPAMAGMAVFGLLSLPLWIWIRQTTGLWQLDWDLAHRASAFTQFGSPSSSLPFPMLHIPILYLKRLHEVWKSVKLYLPLPLWILITLGIAEILLRSKEAFAWIRLLLALCIFHFLFYPLFGRDLRFYHPAMMLMILISGVGVTFVEQRIRVIKLWPSESSKRFFIALAVLCFACFLPGYRSIMVSFQEEPLELRLLGEWVRNEEKSLRTFLASDRRPCFYAGPACGRLVRLPQDKAFLPSEKEFENFLKDRKIDFVVADTRYLPKFCPNYVFLLKSPPPYLKKVKEFEASGERAILYRYE